MRNNLDPNMDMLLQGHYISNLFQSHLDGEIDLNTDRTRKDEFDKLAHMDSEAANMLRQAYQYYSPKVIMAEFSKNVYADPNGFIRQPQIGGMVGVSEIVKTVMTDVGEWESPGEHNQAGGRVDVGLSNISYGSEYKNAHVQYTSQELDRMAYAKSANNMGVFLDIIAGKKKLLILPISEL